MLLDHFAEEVTRTGCLIHATRGLAFQQSTAFGALAALSTPGCTLAAGGDGKLVCVRVYLQWGIWTLRPGLRVRA